MQGWDSALRDWWQHHHDWWRDWWHHLGSLMSNFNELFTLVAGALVVWLLRFLQRWRQERAAAWPSAPGVIETAEVKPGGHGFWAVIQYKYQALGEPRSGKYRRYFPKKADAARFADKMRGLAVQVRYREDNPRVSVLRDEDLRLTGVLV